MSVKTTVHESLPYIDREPTPAQRAAAQSLIDADLSSTTSSEPAVPHPSLPAAYTPAFTPLLTQELTRAATGEPLKAIDLHRYETLELPSSSSSSSSPSLPELQSLLAKAYTQNTYLRSRYTHLSLLDSFGKNAWLVGNWQTEMELQMLEKELADAKRDIDLVNIGRKRMQEEHGEELKGLEETWKRGVGRVLETEVAAQQLRGEILEKRRSGYS
ncbi:Pre-mRNA-splicing factor SPF27 [Pseudomassariella vexata]|uniref:Pre-mRNA-splicing factor SPF27 n=1 Tax=Pseudomassariella vexata TaxID=1141098 RepID=A0A1Y2ED26_9PEZI|nr:Pre-mRNA-splicing factor SPF27 [Pseudomassariella vexata]ORY68715.1 Pre-mRNA-splicing factor SPF27 [Pseudomassariella vexata]